MGTLWLARNGPLSEGLQPSWAQRPSHPWRAHQGLGFPSSSQGSALGPRAPSGPRVQGEPGSRPPTGRAGKGPAGHAPLPGRGEVRPGRRLLLPARGRQPPTGLRAAPLRLPDRAGSPGSRPGHPGRPRPHAAAAPRQPRCPAPRQTRAHSPSHRSANSSGLGARRPMLARRSSSSPSSSSFPAASPPPPPPAPAAPESALLCLGRAPAPLSSRADQSQAPGRTCARGSARTLPPLARPPSSSSSRPGPAAGTPIPLCSPDRLPKAKGKNRNARPPAPPIRRSASNKHKLSQAPPRSR